MKSDPYFVRQQILADFEATGIAARYQDGVSFLLMPLDVLLTFLEEDNADPYEIDTVREYIRRLAPLDAALD